jgi:SPP1 gp7 family putative phage head morphogenesis protein
MAKTANEQLLDALVRHQTYLLRYSNYLRNRLFNVLDKTENDIVNRIRTSDAGITTPVAVRRMQALIESIERMRSASWNEARTLFIDELGELGYQEPIVLDGIIKTVAPVLIDTVMPAARQLRAIVASKPFEGALLKDWMTAMEYEDLRRIKAAVQVGMIAGESMSRVAERVYTAGGAFFTTQNQVQAITRTAVMHVANNAREDFLEENTELMLGEQFVATLDARTTPVCKANDGKVFPVGKGPRPPLHIACRSIRIAALDGEILGARPAKASTTRQLLREYTDKESLSRVGARGDLPRGYRTDYDGWARARVRQLTGQVPRGETYQTWLKKQTRSFQEDTMGVTKAKLFRDGDLKLDKFVTADGTELTLSQLARRHRKAFKDAGLEPEEFLS